MEDEPEQVEDLEWQFSLESPPEIWPWAVPRDPQEPRDVVEEGDGKRKGHEGKLSLEDEQGHGDDKKEEGNEAKELGN